MRAIDRLRAVALALMLLHHFTKWLAGDPRHILPGWEGFAVTDLAAPAFAAAAGASAWLFFAARISRGDRSWRVLATVVRRYGLQIPTGILLQTLTSHDPWRWGVLQTLGAGVVTAIAASSALPAAPLAITALSLGPVTEHVFADRSGYVAEIFGGTFPLLTYTGFALFGVAGARLLLRDPDRGRQALVAGLALAGVAIAIGDAPDRYPGDLSFVLPGIAGTLLLFGVVDRWRVLPESIGTHTLGIFLGHYLAFYAINRYGLRGAFSPAIAIATGVAAIGLAAVIAPRVPQPRWSPRTGWRARDGNRTTPPSSYRQVTVSGVGP